MTNHSNKFFRINKHDYGQNDGSTVPDVTLTGDPGTDQPVLAAAGYYGGVIVALYTSAVAGRGVVIGPCNADATVSGSVAAVPYATLLNGPGEFSGAIGPSGSQKAPVVRAYWQGIVDSQGYDAAATFTIGSNLYCGGSVHGNTGLYTDSTHKGATTTTVVGICTHIPTATQAWLGVASLL
jgi:hypothetical protein